MTSIGFFFDKLNKGAIIAIVGVIKAIPMIPITPKNVIFIIEKWISVWALKIMSNTIKKAPVNINEKIDEIKLIINTWNI